MAVSTAARTELLHIDGAAFEESFSKRPLGVRHTLADHPLLARSRTSPTACRPRRSSATGQISIS
jgi:hypothetical protein